MKKFLMIYYKYVKILIFLKIFIIYYNNIKKFNITIYKILVIKVKIYLL